MRKGFETVEIVVAFGLLFLLVTGIIKLCMKNSAKEALDLDKNYELAMGAEENYAKLGKFCYATDDTLAGLAKRFGVDWCWLNPNCGAANMEVRIKFPVDFHVATCNGENIKHNKDTKDDGSCDDYTFKIHTGTGTGFAASVGGFSKVSLKEITDYGDKMPFACMNDGLLKQVLHVEWYD